MEKREQTDYEQHLKSSQKLGLTSKPSYSAPESISTVKRKLPREREVSRPIVKQSVMFDQSQDLDVISTDKPPQTNNLVNTQREMKKLSPIEQLGIEASQGFQDPITLKKARKQHNAIRRAQGKKTRPPIYDPLGKPPDFE